MSCCACQSDPLAPITLDYIPGDTVEIRLPVVYASSGESYDLTGCTITLTVKAGQDDPDEAALWRMTSPAGGIAIVAPGLAIASPSLVQSRRLGPDKTYYLDVVIRDAAGRIATSAIGYLEAVRRYTVQPA